MNELYLQFFSIIACYLIFYHFCTPIFQNRYKSTLIIIFFIIASFVKLIFLSQNPFLNYSISLIIYIILSLILFKGNKFHLFFYAFFISCISLISEDISYLLIRVIRPDKLQILWSVKYIPLLGIIISRSLELLIVNIFLNIYKSHKHGFIEKKDFFSFILFPCTSILVIISIHKMVDANEDRNILLFFAILGLLFSNLEFSKLYYHNIEKRDIQHELAMIKGKAEEANKFYLEAQLKNKEVNKVIHDINKNYNLLYSYLIDAEYDKAEQVLKKLVNTHYFEKISITNYEVLDNILTYKNDLLKKYRIKVSVEILKKKSINIDEMDGNIIFGNIIDNAIESCKNCNERNIHIIIRGISNMTMIKIINSCIEVKQKDNKFISRKNDKERHGYGLEIIQQYVEKYNGYVKFKFNDAREVFETTVFIPD